RVSIQKFSRFGDYCIDPIIVCADFISCCTSLFVEQVACPAWSHLFVAGSCLSRVSLAIQFSRAILSSLVSRARSMGGSHFFRRLRTNRKLLEFSVSDVHKPDSHSRILHCSYHPQPLSSLHAFLPQLLRTNSFVAPFPHRPASVSKKESHWLLGERGRNCDAGF